MFLRFFFHKVHYSLSGRKTTCLRDIKRCMLNFACFTSRWLVLLFTLLIISSKGLEYICLTQPYSIHKEHYTQSFHRAGLELQVGWISILNTDSTDFLLPANWNIQVQSLGHGNLSLCLCQMALSIRLG